MSLPNSSRHREGNHSQPVSQRPSPSPGFPQHQQRPEQTHRHQHSLPGSLQHSKIRRVKKEFHGMGTLSRYNILKVLGNGTFGVVYKGIHLETGHYVAIKRILIHKEAECFPITALREVDILKELHGPDSVNIVELLETLRDFPPDDKNLNQKQVSRDSKSSVRRAFFMVFPYMSYDLTGILSNPQVNLKESDLKSIMMQLLRGINYMHQNMYLHRDIKASNILINSNGVLKIGDFGLARQYSEPRPTLNTPGGGVTQLTGLVMTRWYRAPEVLLGDDRYGTAVDIWGIGCVFGELYERKPILPGKDDIQQVYDVFNLVGGPNQKTLPNLERYKIEKLKIKMAPCPRTLEKRFGEHMSPEGVQLLGQMLLLDPNQRVTALKALEHPWFHMEPLPTETVVVDFAECHEADMSRFKEQKKKELENKANGQRRPPPNGGNLPPNPFGKPVANQGPQRYIPPVTKPKTSFIPQNRVMQVQAHPQDLNTPPAAPRHDQYYPNKPSENDQGYYGNGFSRRNFQPPSGPSATSNSNQSQSQGGRRYDQQYRDSPGNNSQGFQQQRGGGGGGFDRQQPYDSNRQQQGSGAGNQGRVHKQGRYRDPNQEVEPLAHFKKRQYSNNGDRWKRPKFDSDGPGGLNY